MSKRFSQPTRSTDEALRGAQAQDAAAAIRALAARHKVAYTETSTDAWANNVTRLAGDDVALDEIELLLIALQRAGHLSRPEAVGLQVKYLRELKS